jgi:ankyrin repeat protein
MLPSAVNGSWNQPFPFTGQYCYDLAISLAIIENEQRVIDYLIRKGAKLNVEGGPAITFAAHNSDKATIDKLLEAGARIDAVKNVGCNAYSCALYSERFDLLPFLLKKGLRVDADNGKSFRQAVSNRQREAVEFFLKSGIDPDLRRPGQVYPFNPTAAQVAARNDDFDIGATARRSWRGCNASRCVRGTPIPCRRVQRQARGTIPKGRLNCCTATAHAGPDRVSPTRGSANLCKLKALQLA